MPTAQKRECAGVQQYRGITLLAVAYEVVSKILYLRILPYTNKIIGNYQCGFQPGKSTLNQIFSLRQILEKTKEHNIESHHLFIDLSVAYDNINRSKLFTGMNEFESQSSFLNCL